VSRSAAPLDPTWPAFEAAGARWPYVAAALDPIGGWISGTALLLLVLATADRLSSGWTSRKGATAALLLVAGVVVAGVDGGETVVRWLAAGVTTGVVLLLAYALVLRRQLALLPVAAAVMAVVSTLRQGTFQAFPGALSGALTATVLIFALGVVWSRMLTSDSRVDTSC
jgi:hypothetical protein